MAISCQKTGLTVFIVDAFFFYVLFGNIILAFVNIHKFKGLRKLIRWADFEFDLGLIMS